MTVPTFLILEAIPPTRGLALLVGAGLVLLKGLGNSAKASFTGSAAVARIDTRKALLEELSSSLEDSAFNTMMAASFSTTPRESREKCGV